MDPTEPNPSLSTIIYNTLRKHICNNGLEHFGMSASDLDFQLKLYANYFARLNFIGWNEKFGGASNLRTRTKLRRAHDLMCQVMERLKDDKVVGLIDHACHHLGIYEDQEFSRIDLDDAITKSTSMLELINLIVERELGPTTEGRPGDDREFNIALTVYKAFHRLTGKNPISKTAMESDDQDAKLWAIFRQLGDEIFVVLQAKATWKAMRQRVRDHYSRPLIERSPLSPDTRDRPKPNRAT
jgi:hypothetical protein